MDKKFSLNRWSLSNNVINHKNQVLKDGTFETLCSIVRANRATYKESIENNEVPNNYLLEYLHKTNKLFFDIDSVNIPIEDLKTELRHLYNQIDAILCYDLDRDRYLVFYKDCKDSIVRSLHIINYQYSISTEDAFSLAEQLNTRDITLCKGVDTRVYYSGRQLFLPYNTKPVNDKYTAIGLDPLSSKEHFFIEYPKQNYTRAVDKYLVCITKNTELIKLQQDCKEENTTRNTNENGNVPNVYISSENQQEILSILMSIDIIHQNSPIWIQTTKLLCVMDDPELLDTFLTLSASKSTLYTYLDNKKFVRKLTKDTKTNYSRLPDIEPELAFKQLLRIINKLQKEKIYYTEYLNNQALNIAKYINNIYEYIEQDCILNKIDHYLALNDSSKKKANYSIDFILDDDEVITYSVNNGFLTSNKSDTAHNFIIDELIEPLNKKDFFDETFNSIQDIKSSVDNFMKSDYKILSAEVFCGGGKSSQIQTPIVEQIINGLDIELQNNLTELIQNDRYSEIDDFLLEQMKDIPRIIVITPRTSLNRKELHDKKKFNFISHLEVITLKKRIDDIKDKESEIYKKLNRQYLIMCRYCNMIVSPNSIEKVFLYSNTEHTELLRPTLLILDEFDSIFQTYNFENTTFDDKTKKRTNEDGSVDRSSLMEMSYLHLLKLIEYSKKVLFLDANINKLFFDLILKHTDIPRTNVKNIKIYQNNFGNTNFILCDSTETLLNDYYSNFDKKLEICCTSKKMCEKVFMSSVLECYELQEDSKQFVKIKNQNILMICGEGICYFNTTDTSKCILPEKFGLFKRIVDNENKNYLSQDKTPIYKKYNVDAFHELIYQLKIIHMHKEDIDTLKDNFLLDYNKSILDYSITKFIRSPTITIGNSFEVLNYFYRVYGIISNNTITASVVNQSFFRSRFIESQSIMLCGAKCNVKQPSYKIHLDKVRNIFETQEETSTITKYITPYDRQRKALFHNEHPKLVDILIQNFQLKIHSNTNMFNELYSLLKYNFDKSNFTFLTINKETDYIGDLNENTKIQKQIDMDNYKNIDILKLSDAEINNLKALSKINGNALQEYIKHSRQVRYVNFEDIENYYFLRNPLELLEPSIDETENVNYDTSVNYINNCFLVQYGNRLTTLRYFTEPEWNIKKEYYNEDYGISYTPLQDILKDFHRSNYYNGVNTDYTLNKYKLHTKELSNFLSRTLLLKKIIHYDNKTQSNKTLEEYETIVNHRMKMKKKKENILRTLCLFLKIDLEQFQDIYYRYILDNSKNKFIIQFDTIFSDKNVAKTDELEDMNFIEWFNGVLIDDYNSLTNQNIKKVSSKNHKTILVILKFYLKDINIGIDYECDYQHIAEYKCFQFVIKPIIDLKIITKPKLNPYYSCNPPIIKTDANGNEVIKYTHNFQNINNMNPIVKGITFLYQNIEHTFIINNTLIVRPIKKLRKQVDNSYLDYEKKFMLNNKSFSINNKVYKHDITIPNEKGLKMVKGKLENTECKRYIYTTDPNYKSHSRRSVNNTIVRQSKKVDFAIKDTDGMLTANKLPFIDEINNLYAPPCVLIKDKDKYNTEYLMNVIEVFKCTKSNLILN